MGVIVPAFDGFEEMFVENSSGEAMSAMGLLLGALNSKGALIIAARKAYFEFENLATQARLYDSIRSYSVGFGKLELKRWDRKHFIEYCEKRSVADSLLIYDRVSERLTPGHSLLTRPVLVKRLVDIAKECPSLDGFLQKIHASGTDFFSVFVRSIVEREANEKWIDRSGEIARPLLTVDEHCELLAQVALAMWDARVDYLKRENLEFVTDYFSETKKRTPHQASQIREWVRGHALFIPSLNAHNAVEFDHEEFRIFFLGEGLADLLRPMSERSRTEVLNVLRRGVLPRHAQHAFIRAIKRVKNLNRVDVAKFLMEIGGLDGQASFTQENCGSLIVRLLSEVDSADLKASALAFAADSLRDRQLHRVHFDKCYFAPTSLETTKITNCTFSNCTFSELRVYSSTDFKEVKFAKCSIDGLRLVDRETETWEPQAIRTQLELINIKFLDEEEASEKPLELNLETDEELRDMEKLVRYFMRSTHISESVIRMKLGAHSQSFMDNIVPTLIRNNVLLEIENRGGDSQRRFKLGMQLQSLNATLAESDGSFGKFLAKTAAKGTQ